VPGNWGGSNYINAVSSRHTTKKKAKSVVFNTINEDAMGPVVFCDGHASLFGRKDALRGRHSGRPDPDPSGF